jgi:hypothetical protein
MFSVKWSPVNQAWFVMFGDQVLRIFNAKSEAEEYLDWLENQR